MTARLCSALCLLLLLAAPQAAAQVSEGKFTQIYIDALRAQAPDLEVRLTGPMELEIGPDGEEITAYLGNAYARYLTDPDALQLVIDGYVSATLEQLESDFADIDVTRIVPVVKDAGYLAELLQTRGDRIEVAHERYNEHLTILCAEDSPQSIRYLSDEDLEELGVDRAALRGQAIANLDRLLPELEAQGADGTYMLIADGNYEASLVLFDDIWQGDIWTSGSLPVEGEVVIAVPARDMLLVTGSRDAGGLAILRDIAADVIASDPYFLTDQLFVYRDGRFQPFGG